MTVSASKMCTTSCSWRSESEKYALNISRSSLAVTYPRFSTS